MLRPAATAPSRSPLGTLAVSGLVAVSAAGLIAELGFAAHAGFPEWLFAMLSLSFEANLPTWYSSMLLFGCGAFCVATGARAPSHGRHWYGLGACLMYISLDEVAELHENLGGHFGGSGLLYFDWVIPAAVIVAILGLIFLPFVARLPPWLRRRLVLAGAIYVGGALLMELPLGYVAESRGSDNLVYGLIDWVEETMELGGATLFLLSVSRFYQETR